MSERIHQDASAVFADDKFIPGSYVHKFLRSDGVEASAAGILIYGHYRQMIMYAPADTIISAQRTVIQFISKLFPFSLKRLLLGGRGLHDTCKFLLFGSKVSLAYGYAVGDGINGILLFGR